MQEGEIKAASVEDIEGNLAENRALLEINAQTNPGVIEQYERRQREVSNWFFNPNALRVS